VMNKVTGQVKVELKGTACSRDYPCDVRLSPDGNTAAILVFTSDTVQHHQNLLATKLEVWNITGQEKVGQESIMLRNLDGIHLLDNGSYISVSQKWVDDAADVSWWTSTNNFAGLITGDNDQVHFNPQVIETQAQNDCYFCGTCSLRLGDGKIECAQEFISREKNSYQMQVIDDSLVLIPVDEKSVTEPVELYLPPDFDEKWSARLLGYTEQYQKAFYCLDKNARNETCLIYDPAEAETIAEVEDIFSLRFSPDGDTAAFINRELKALFLVNLKDSKLIRVKAYEARAWFANPVFNNAGTELAYLVQDLQDAERLSLEWVDAVSGKVLRRITLDDSGIYQPSVLASNSDDSLIAVGDADGKVYVLDQGKGKVLYSWQAYTDSIVGLVFSRYNKKIVSMDADGTIKIWGVNE